MNPRQRRGVLLLGIAGLGAVAVFLLVGSYLSDVRSQLGPMVEVLAAGEDLAPFSSLDDDAVVLVEVPTRWLSPNSYSDTTEIGNRVTATAIPAGTVLSDGMFLDRPAIGPGERELAILVDAETGVGGKLTSGAVVDIFATFAGDETTPPSVRIVVQRAEVIEVGSPVDVQENGLDPGAFGFGSGEQLPVTFRLSVEDARTLVFVESFASTLRLALRSPLDDEILGGDISVFVPDGDDLGMLINPVPRDGRNAARVVPDPPVGDEVAEDEPDDGEDDGDEEPDEDDTEDEQDEEDEGDDEPEEDE